MAAQTYIGLLSGTSIDSIDAAIFQFSDLTVKTLYTYSHPIPSELKALTLALGHGAPTFVSQLGELETRWGRLFAQSVQALLHGAQMEASAITAIGSHGQTLWHQPQGLYPFTMQIGDPHIIAKTTGITTIADFRRTDLALGGQGAPLVPLFHQAYFHSPDQDRVILNLGGIANISVLTTEGLTKKSVTKKSVIGYDTGPANGLLDAWCLEQIGEPYDDKGAWARTGCVQQHVLSALLSDPYFSKNYPKSTGKDYFNIDWVRSHLIEISPVDLQATLTELTAYTIAAEIKKLATQPMQIFVCGGGFYNDYLLSRLKHYLPRPHEIDSTLALGISPNWVEAACFAWLAKAYIEGIETDYRAITGASSPAILGARF